MLQLSEIMEYNSKRILALNLLFNLYIPVFGSGIVLRVLFPMWGVAMQSVWIAFLVGMLLGTVLGFVVLSLRLVSMRRDKRLPILGRVTLKNNGSFEGDNRVTADRFTDVTQCVR